MISKISRLSSRPSSCSTSGVSQTRPNQAYTPAEMADMVSRGIPVSNFVSECFNDGSPSSTFDDLPLEHTRGIDVNEVWNAQQDSRKKLVGAHNTDVATYGS